MTCSQYLAIIPSRNISKFSKYHSPLRGSWYFGQFWTITRGIIAKYHYKSCYYLYLFIKINLTRILSLKIPNFEEFLKNMHYSTNHKDHNFLNCDWFKKLIFPTNSLAKLLSDSSTNQSNSKLQFKSTNNI